MNRPIPVSVLREMSEGVPILNKKTKKCVVEKVKTNQFKIILTQGLNRQIRRMCEYFDYKVRSLKRVRIMNIKLDIPVGEYREFTAKELNTLNQLVVNSSKTYNSDI